MIRTFERIDNIVRVTTFDVDGNSIGYIDFNKDEIAEMELLIE